MEFISEIIYREQFRIENGTHFRDGILFVLDGSFTGSVQGKAYTAVPGDICVFHAHTLFQRRVLEPIQCIYLQFEQFPVLLPQGLLPAADRCRRENTLPYLARAVEEGDGVLIRHFLWDILLLDCLQSQKQRQKDETVERCIAYLEQNHASRITLDQMAREFAISKQWLIRKFRAHTGKTPIEYLTDIRIAQGKLLLKNTAQTVGEIAQRCGYENIYYFSSQFKRVTGLSPTAYRRLISL